MEERVGTTVRFEKETQRTKKFKKGGLIKQPGFADLILNEQGLGAK